MANETRWRPLLGAVMIGAGLAAGCRSRAEKGAVVSPAASSPASPLQGRADASLPDRKHFVSLELMTQATIALNPTGASLATATPKGLVVIGTDKSVSLLRFPAEGVPSLRWSAKGRYLVAHMGTGDELDWGQTYVFDVTHSNYADRPPSRVWYPPRHRVVDWPNARDAQLLLQGPDSAVYLCDAGSARCDVHLPRAEGFVVAASRDARFVVTVDNTAGRSQSRKWKVGNAVTGEWQTLATFDQAEIVMEPQVVGMSSGGEEVFALDSRERGVRALVRIDSHDGKVRTMFEEPSADVDSVSSSPATNEPQMISSVSSAKRLAVLRPDLTPRMDELTRLIGTAPWVLARSTDDRSWLVESSVEWGGWRREMFTRASATSPQVSLFKLEQTAPVIPPLPLRQVDFNARDGTLLQAFITLPAADSGSLTPGSSAGPPPLVVVAHGGPEGRENRDRMRYRYDHQWLASRGYAVLSVNFRGTSGLGRKLLTSGWGLEGHRRAIEDVVDAVDWAIANGHARRGRVAVLGGSYGGYVALMSVLTHPELYACAVSDNGVTDVAAICPRPGSAGEMGTGGICDLKFDGWQDRAAEWKSASPVGLAKALARSVLVLASTRDPIVPIEQARSFRAAAAGVNPGLLTYVAFDSTSHGIADGQLEDGTLLARMALTEAFLAPCLQGRFLPIGNELLGVGIDEQVGLERLTGALTGAQRAPVLYLD